jgi:hypothetical protein
MRRGLRLTGLLLGASAGISWIVACSGSAAPAAENHACFRALDCEDGLVCVAGRCTSDISTLSGDVAGQAPEGAAPRNTPRRNSPDAGSGG